MKRNTIIAVVIGVAVVGYFVYQNRKKKKSGSLAMSASSAGKQTTSTPAPMATVGVDVEGLKSKLRG